MCASVCEECYTSITYIRNIMKESISAATLEKHLKTFVMYENIHFFDWGKSLHVCAYTHAHTQRNRVPTCKKYI